LKVHPKRAGTLAAFGASKPRMKHWTGEVASAGSTAGMVGGQRVLDALGPGVQAATAGARKLANECWLPLRRRVVDVASPTLRGVGSSARRPSQQWAGVAAPQAVVDAADAKQSALLALANTRYHRSWPPACPLGRNPGWRCCASGLHAACQPGGIWSRRGRDGRDGLSK
jgi:hypothetical protein